VRLLLLFLAAGLLALSASAQEPDLPPGEASLRVRATSVENPASLRTSEVPPLQGLYAGTAPAPDRKLGWFAQGLGFAVGPRAALYDLEGGASLLLDEGVHLTAGYRVMGIGLGFDALPDAPSLEPSALAPFVGFAVDF
jgi:hypothetical protein